MPGLDVRNELKSGNMFFCVSIAILWSQNGIHSFIMNKDSSHGNNRRNYNSWCAYNNLI